jgi:hypothetical protein
MVALDGGERVLLAGQGLLLVDLGGLWVVLTGGWWAARLSDDGADVSKTRATERGRVKVGARVGDWPVRDVHFESSASKGRAQRERGGGEEGPAGVKSSERGSSGGDYEQGRLRASDGHTGERQDGIDAVRGQAHAY